MSIRYRIELHRDNRRLPLVLPGESVIPWLQGFATARNEEDVLDDLEDGLAEDTRCVQALQLGEAAGWFVYLWPEYPPTPTTPRKDTP